MILVSDIMAGESFEIFTPKEKTETFIKKEDLGRLTLCEDVEGKRSYLPSDCWVKEVAQ